MKVCSTVCMLLLPSLNATPNSGTLEEAMPGNTFARKRALQDDPALLPVKGEDLEDYLRERNARYADIQLLEAGLRKIVAAVGPEQELPPPA